MDNSLARSVSFNFTNVETQCNKMYEARRNISQQLYDMRTAYFEILPNQWDGNVRRDFHRVVFGEDSNSGLVGQMLGQEVTTETKGLCGALYRLLNILVKYVNDVSVADNPASQEKLNVNENIGDVESVFEVPPMTDFFSGVSDKTLILDPNVVSSINEKFNSYKTNMINSMAEFKQAYQECGIKGSAVQLLWQVMDSLDKTLTTFSEEIDKILKAVDESVQSGIDAQQAVQSNISV